MKPEPVLKVPKDNSIGITPEAVEFIMKYGRIELFGEMTVPNHGTITSQKELEDEF